MEGMTHLHIRPPRRKTQENASRLFRVRRKEPAITVLPARTVAIERSLQRLMESHLPQLLNVNFVASEYRIHTRPAGRIDTLGIDLHGAPVVIEYKRGRSDNSISQGLFYLDWLEDHRGEFRLLVHDKLGPPAAAVIKWAETRLICVAADFHLRDLRAMHQTKWRIELFKYCWFGDDLLYLALIDS